MLNAILVRRNVEGEQHGGVPAPSAVEVGRDFLRSGERWHRTLAVTGYPREVSQGWLAPLLKAAGELDLALHIAPLPGEVAADRLRRQRARLESSRRIDANRGRLSDPTLDAAAQDAEELAGALARGESRLFRAGLYLSIVAPSRAELDERTQRARALCASMLLHTVPATFRAFDGWLSTLPLGSDRLGLLRAFDSKALAAGFPFASSDPPMDQNGVFYGVTDTGAPVITDRFARANFNRVLLAYSGAGKSYTAKLEALRLACAGVQVFILDPEGEYQRMCEAVGGSNLPLAGPRAVAINPFDLPAESEGPRALDERILFIADLLELLLGGLDSGELAVLDRAARAAYEKAGISSDPATHRRPAPLLRDLATTLTEHGATGASLAERIYPYTQGSHSYLFERPTTARPEGHLVCYSLRGLPERLRGAAMMLCLDATWRCLEGPLRRRVVLVDEAWDFMRQVPGSRREPPGAQFLFRLAKAARKRWTGLTTMTQDPGDLLDTALGRAVVSNATEHLLMRQSSQAIERVADTFSLTRGERSYLLACPVGHGLLLTGEQRIPIQIKASSAEHELVTTNPAELADDGS
jgi:type IV secretory pathway VirB4 component